MRAYMRMRACKSARTHLPDKSNFKLSETTLEPSLFLFFRFFRFRKVVERNGWTYSLKGEKPDQLTHSQSPLKERYRLLINLLNSLANHTFGTFLLTRNFKLCYNGGVNVLVLNVSQDQPRRSREYWNSWGWMIPPTEYPFGRGTRRGLVSKKKVSFSNELKYFDIKTYY